MHAHFFQSSDKKCQPLGKSDVERMLQPQSIDDWIWFSLRYCTTNDQKTNHPIYQIILTSDLTFQVIDPVKKESGFYRGTELFWAPKHALCSFVSINKAKQNVRVPIPTTAKNNYFTFNSSTTTLSVNALNTQKMNSKRSLVLTTFFHEE